MERDRLTPDQASHSAIKISPLICFLALALMFLALPTTAADGKLFFQERGCCGIDRHYLDAETVREASGHRLVWLKRTEILDDDRTRAEKTAALFLIEFDCMNRQLAQERYEMRDGAMVAVSPKFAGGKRFDPDSSMRQMEKAACGKSVPPPAVLNRGRAQIYGVAVDVPENIRPVRLSSKSNWRSPK